MKKPMHYALAEKTLGTREVPGTRNNPVIMKYYKDVGHGWVGGDEVPWCAAFVGAMLERAGYASTRNLAARSYLKWGQKVTTPQIGDVVIFRRGRSSWQGHVGFYAGDAGARIRVLGGNQADRVSIATYPKSRLLGIRRPRTIGASRTIKGAAVAGMGAVASGGGQALGLVSQQATEAGGMLQTLGGVSQWFVVGGVVLTIVGTAVAIWARLDDLGKPERQLEGAA